LSISIGAHRLATGTEIIMTLPKLYTLETAAVVGHLRQMAPTIYCPQCHRRIAHYQELELWLDLWPRCDLVSAQGGEYFVSEQLLTKLAGIGAQGYRHRPAPLYLSEDFQRLYPGIHEVPAEIAPFHYLIITGRADGPWTMSDPGEPCPACGQPRAIQKRRLSFDEIESLRLGDTSMLQPTLVFPESWHGEAIFYHPETRKPLITQAVATILADLGTLRKEEVADQAAIRQRTPKLATRLERVGWQTPTCSVLGPADWASV
jgi:hypothetical protein